MLIQIVAVATVILTSSAMAEERMILPPVEEPVTIPGCMTNNMSYWETTYEGQRFRVSQLASISSGSLVASSMTICCNDLEVYCVAPVVYETLDSDAVPIPVDLENVNWDPGTLAVCLTNQKCPWRPEIIAY